MRRHEYGTLSKDNQEAVVNRLRDLLVDRWFVTVEVRHDALPIQSIRPKVVTDCMLSLAPSFNETPIAANDQEVCVSTQYQNWYFPLDTTEFDFAPDLIQVRFVTRFATVVFAWQCEGGERPN